MTFQGPSSMTSSTVSSDHSEKAGPMTASELYQAGNLTAAVQAAIEDVKRHPTEVGRRAFFCELLCFAGDLERADKQLDTICTQQPDAAVTASVFRQLVRAEQARREVFEQGRAPELLDEPTPVIELHLQALLAFREGRADEAVALLEQADEQRPAVRVTCGDAVVDSVRDLDDLTASFCEVLTSTGKYFWVPWERIESIEFHAPEHPRDLLWRPAHMIVRGGPDGEVYIPALYYGSAGNDDDQIRLGRATDWIGDDGEVVRGIGQRTWLLGDEDRPLLNLDTLSLTPATERNPVDTGV